MTRPPGGQRQELKLYEAATTLVDECRMVLPGVQAIFGFQLAVVFQQRFGEDLDKTFQYMHLAALVLVATAAAIIMAPAAYHRLHGAREVTDHFIRISSRLLLLALAPLAIGLSLDVFILGELIIGTGVAATVLAAIVFVVMIFMWYVFPLGAGRRKHA